MTTTLAPPAAALGNEPLTPGTSVDLDALARYLLAVGLLVGGILIQYVWVPPPLPFWEGELLNSLTTYGPGLVGFFVLVGVPPVRNFLKRSTTAVLEGLRWYGLFAVLSIIVVVVLTSLYLSFDATRFNELISRNTSVDLAGEADPWAWIVLSFPIGVVEETLFRGFVLGGALRLFGTRDWKLHAVWTSLLFTGVHLYYGLTYLEVSPLFYVQIFLLGLSFAFAYVQSGGNLWMIAFLHGLFDATSFSEFLPGFGVEGAAALRYGIIGIAALVAIVLYLREREPLLSVREEDRLAPIPAPVPAPGSALWPPASPPTSTAGPASSGTPGRPSSVCQGCGALVVWDLLGPPSHCPRCRSPMLGMPAPGSHLTPLGPPPGSTPPSYPFSMSNVGPRGPPKERFDRLEPGAWPPAVEVATPPAAHAKDDRD